MFATRVHALGRAEAPDVTSAYCACDVKALGISLADFGVRGRELEAM